MMARLRPVKRYMLRVVAAAVVYVLGIFAANYLLRDGTASGALAWGLALIPGLAIASLFYSVGMFIVETKDEFMRMLLVRQQLIASGFALSTIVTWGFAEEYMPIPHVEAEFVILLWAVGQFVGMVSNRLTHGSWGECW
jgi:hypothetical protein